MDHIHTPAGDRWRERLLRADGGLAPRVESLEIEQAFWHDRAGICKQDEYAQVVFEALVREIGNREIRSVIEIGPGWGNYTIPLAQRYERLSAVDVSPDNLSYLRSRLNSMGRPIHTVCSPWEEAKVLKADLVFGYNCLYRLQEPERFLEKMDKSAEKLCVIGMNRPPELPWLRDLEQAGISLHYTRQGCEQLQEVARDLGIPARLINIPNVRTYHYESEQALLKRAEGFLLKPCDRRKLMALLLPYHRQEADGSLSCEYHFYSQLLVWEP